MTEDEHTHNGGPWGLEAKDTGAARTRAVGTQEGDPCLEQPLRQGTALCAPTPRTLSFAPTGEAEAPESQRSALKVPRWKSDHTKRLPSFQIRDLVYLCTFLSTPPTPDSSPFSNNP